MTDSRNSTLHPASPPQTAERGSSLVFVLLMTLVSLALIYGVLQASRRQSSASLEAVSTERARYAALAGLWAAANSVSAGGSGDLTGSISSGSYGPQTGTDADGDGFVDFSPDSVLRSLPSGSFEVRVAALPAGQNVGRQRVLAKGVADGRIRTLAAVLAPQGVRPFQRAIYSTRGIRLTAGRTTVDSYDSNVGDYQNTAPKGEHGHVACAGDVALGANSVIKGDARPGPTGSVSVGSGSNITGDTTPLPQPPSMPAPKWNVPPPADTNNAALGIPYGGHFHTQGQNVKLPPGKYVFRDLKIDADLIIGGASGDEVEIYLLDSGNRSFHVRSGGNIYLERPGKAEGPTVRFFNPGGLRVEERCDFFVDGGNGGNPRPLPADAADPELIQYQSDSTSNRAVEFIGYNNVSGVFYVPDGGFLASEDVHLLGAIVAGGVRAGEDDGIHYDESLATLSINTGTLTQPEAIYEP
ncbi:MAG: hypothetical protein D6731_17475 [Planctomycetota bacterium]|nr:MAG: hypothetical protein D6731_17475 [Planctomycetota bacterium]